jgi:hypothetical protein
MAKENRLWGAERIRGELLKLGLRVCKRTVQKYMRGVRIQPLSIVDNSFTPSLLDNSSRPGLWYPLNFPCFEYHRVRIRMTHHVFVLLLLCVLLISVARLCFLCWPHHGPVRLTAAKGSRLPRRLQPRSPDDCPACRLVSTPSSSAGQAPAPVGPWSEVKSRRGAAFPHRHPRLRL